MQAKDRIENEFDEPLRDVVKGYAVMKFSRSLVAEALDVSIDSLTTFSRREGINFSRRPMQHREIPGRPPRMIRHNGREQSLSEWAAELGVAPCTIHKRLRTRGRIV